ncbi:uncharacterized protein DUF1524 [Barrientosiimonas humi]|uniref:Uncharacterized protein DUF1524 n=2 Tax=Barrientosiimonas TaxID=1535207 RepID=A0A542XBE2_9MICO|nr:MULTISPECIES: HNH endonuclease family protein [Barrientosiimonas]TQL33155.1 uncharacterized protein DUF1524 [Barrientosiimonas humi]BDZ58037.1 hypothetical protein GCM10025872_16940 [Barrientosiimonas endolithica]CAG7573144.1 hypothetical protein BH39T_PBIAJDOK_01769 [Barrientosiimonas humi]
MIRPRRRTSASIAVVAVAALAWSAQPASAAQIGTVSGSTAAAQLKKGMTSSMTPSAARSALGGLTVKAAGSMTGYSRDLFPHWRDASTWGWPVAPNDACNARNAALYRDGQNVTMSSTCTNLAGTWIDPYSANKFNAASDIDIDHIVPLANAWRSGAAGWSTTRKTQYANDPLVLVSSWDSLNQAKGDKGPEAWKPPLTASHCLYATRWTFTKQKYGLSVTSAEKSALTNMLGPC